MLHIQPSMVSFSGELSKEYFEFRNRRETQVTHNNNIEGYFDHNYRLEVEDKGGWNILSGGQSWISFSISDHYAYVYTSAIIKCLRQKSRFTAGTPDSAMIRSYSLFSFAATVSGMKGVGPTSGVCISGGKGVKRKGGSWRVKLFANFSSLICGRFSTTPAKCFILD